MPTWEFPGQDPIDLRVRIPPETSRCRRSPRRPPRWRSTAATETLAATRVEFEDGTLSIIVPDQSGLCRDGSVDVMVELPEGSSCRVHTASADVRCTGELGALDVHTASGDVSAERVSGQARVDTASGDVSLGRPAEAEVESASGDVRIGQ